MAKSEECVISDSALCKWINSDCDKCYMSKMKDDTAIKGLSDFEVTLSLLPPDFDDLQGEECQFCKGEKNKRAGFATIDLAHSEPKSETGMFFGFGKKIRRKVGSYMFTSISICRECRKAFRIAELLKWFTSIVAFAIAAAVAAISGINDSLNGFIIFGILVLAVIAGYLIGGVITNEYIKSKKDRMRFDVFEIPIGAEMKENGWFKLQEGSRYLFTKKPQNRRVKDLKADKKSDDGIQQISFI